jgi:phenylacetate-CoA ligase
MLGETGENLKRIISLCNYAIEKSPFYRQTLKQLTTWEDFFSLPLLTGEQIRQHDDLQGSITLLTGSPRGAVLVSSTASTGPRKLIYREYREQHRISRRLAMALRLAGISSEDRVANMFHPGNLAGAWMGMHEAIERLGATVLPIGNAISTAEQSQLIHWLKPTALVGLPSTLIQLVQQGLPSVQKLLCGGEGLNSKVRSDLETSLGFKIPLVYANVECGILGIQCKEVRGSNQYHIIDEDCFVEIIDIATGKPGKEGEIIVTHLHRRLQPIIRYRLGDRGKWIHSSCRCGLTSPRIELKGRLTDELVIVNGVTIRYNEVESAMADLGGYLGRFQIRVSRIGILDTLKIIIEGEMLTCESIHATIYAQLPEIANLHRQGKLIIEIVKRGNIPTQGGKAQKIVDER